MGDDVGAEENELVMFEGLRDLVLDRILNK